MDALPDGGYLVIQSTMQRLSVDNDKRQEAMNSHLLNTAEVLIPKWEIQLLQENVNKRNKR